MHTFWLILHVTAAVLFTGPFIIAPMTGVRALRDRDAVVMQQCGRTTMQYALLSLITLGLGILAVSSASDEDFNTAWVIISITLFVIALALALFISSPALSKASRMLAADREQERKEEAEAESPTERQKDADELRRITDARVLAHGAARERLQEQRGRIVAASGTTAVLVMIVIILTVAKPFG